MTILLVVVLASLLFKCFLLLRVRAASFLIIQPILVNIWSLLSMFNLETPHYMLFQFVALLECCELVYVLFVVYQSRKINLIYKDFVLARNPEVPYIGVFLIVFSVVTFIAITGYAPRAFYEHMVEGNRSGGMLLSIVMLLSSILSTYATSMRNAIVLIAVLGLVGSKGIILAVLVYYFLHQYSQGKVSISLVFKIVVLFAAFGYFTILFTRGVESVFLYYLKFYFRYIGNFSGVADSVQLMPNYHFFPLLNDFIPGLSRLSGVFKNDLHAELFPDSFSQGVALGMLGYENFFRTGVLFYPFYILLKIAFLYIYINLSLGFKDSLMARSCIVMGSLRMSFVSLLVFVFKSVAKKIFMIKS